MGRHKGSQNAITPLKRRNPALHKRTVKQIRFVGVQNLANDTGLSKQCIYNLINGNEGVSTQIESKIYSSLEKLTLKKKSQTKNLEKELEMEAEQALSV